MGRRRAVPHAPRCALLAAVLVVALFELRPLLSSFAPALDDVPGFADATATSTGLWVVESDGNRPAGVERARSGRNAAPADSRPDPRGVRQRDPTGSATLGETRRPTSLLSAALAWLARSVGGTPAESGGRAAGAIAPSSSKSTGSVEGPGDARVAPGPVADPQGLLATTADLASYPESEGAHCTFRPKARRIALLSISRSAPRHAALWRAWLESSRGRFPAVALTGESTLCLERCRAVVPPVGQRATGDDADGCIRRCEPDAVWNPVCGAALREYVGVAGPAREELPRHLFTLYAQEKDAGRGVASVMLGQGGAAANKGAIKGKGKKKKKKTAAKRVEGVGAIATAQNNATDHADATHTKPRLLEDHVGGNTLIVGDGSLAVVDAARAAEGAASIARILDDDALLIGASNVGSIRRALRENEKGVASQDASAPGVLGPPLDGSLLLLRAMLMRASRDPSNGYFLIVDDSVAPLYDAPTLWHALISRAEGWRSDLEEADEPLEEEVNDDFDEDSLIVVVPQDDANATSNGNSTATAQADEPVKDAVRRRRAFSRRSLLQEAVVTVPESGSGVGVVGSVAPSAAAAVVSSATSAEAGSQPTAVRTMLPAHVVSEPAAGSTTTLSLPDVVAAASAHADTASDPPEMTQAELQSWNEEQNEELRASARRVALAHAAAKAVRPPPPLVCVGNLAKAVRDIKAAEKRGRETLVKTLQAIQNSCAGAMLSEQAREAFPEQSPWKLSAKALATAREADNAPRSPDGITSEAPACSGARRDGDFSFLDLSGEKMPARGEHFPQASPVRIFPETCPLFAAGFVPGTERPLLRGLVRCDGGIDVVPCDPSASKEDSVWW